MKTIAKTVIIIFLLVLCANIKGYQQCYYCGSATGTYSSAFGYSATATAIGSMAFGYNAQASNFYSTAIGLYSSASGGQSFALGQYAIASADQSYAFGKYVTSAASGAITIGSGTSGPFTTLVNNKSNSLMIGFLSNKPTFYVGPPSALQSTGFVGISTSDPKQPLHLDGNFLVTGLNSSILLADQPPIPGVTGDADFGIEYLDNGLNFWKPWSPLFPGGNYYMFIQDNGYVGIGTGRPLAKLHVEGSAVVNGNLNVSSLATTSGTKIVVVDQHGLLSNADIPAGDNLGSHIATRNIQLSGKFITHDQEDGTNEGIYVGPSGNVGIKTDQISNDDDFTVYAPTTKNAQMRVKGEGTRSSLIWTSNGTRSLGIGVTSTECAIYEGTAQVIKILDGRVGIGLPEGQAMPGNHKLYVSGGITTEEVKVKLKGNWSDYVFHDDYKLLSLNELEHFININKHLPDIPSENEIKKEGIDLAKTDALLLKKIEELTLYIITQEKRIHQLERELHK